MPTHDEDIKCRKLVFIHNALHGLLICSSFLSNSDFILLSDVLLEKYAWHYIIWGSYAKCKDNFQDWKFFHSFGFSKNALGKYRNASNKCLDAYWFSKLLDGRLVDGGRLFEGGALVWLLQFKEVLVRRNDNFSAQTYTCESSVRCSVTSLILV